MAGHRAVRRVRVLGAALAVLSGTAVVGVSASAGAAPPTCQGRPATIVGTVHADRIHGTDGPDVIVSGAGPDVIFAGAGDDTVCGGRGSDRLLGEDGVDKLNGEQSSDRLVGGQGDDRLFGGTGFDSLQGDGGDDYLLPGGSAVVTFARSNGGVIVNLVAGTAVGPDTGTDRLRRITQVSGTDHADHLIGSDRNDMLNGHGGDDVVEGGAGNDVLAGGQGHDLVDGADGNDVINPGGHREGGAADTLAGGSGADLVTVSASDDATGGDGDDALAIRGTAVSASIDGGAGTDYLAPDESSGIDVDMAGDTMSRAGRSSSVTAVENVRGTGHHDQLRGDDSANILLGRGGTDAIAGRGGDDHLSGGRRNDQVDGGAGSDGCTGEPPVQCEYGWNLLGAMPGGNASNTPVECEGTPATIVGTAGRDVITGTSGRDVIAALEQNDVVHGAGGDDTACGGAKSDKLFGEVGADRLYGGEGRNTLFGGRGNDVLSAQGITGRYHGGPGNDECDGTSHNANFFYADAGDDQLTGDSGYLVFPAAAAGVSVDLGSGTAIGADTGHDSVSGIYSVQGTRHADHIAGDNLGNLLDGSGGPDVIRGRDGNDTLISGSGADRLVGGAGDDAIDFSYYLVNSRGADTEIGGPGEDRLSAGPGDTSHGGDGRDVIQVRGGRLALVDGGTGRDWVVGEEGPLTVDLAAGTMRYPSGSAPLRSIEKVRGSAHSDTLLGNAGRNVLVGGRGDDVLRGRSGDDLLEGDVGRDIGWGGPGTDGCDIAMEIRHDCEQTFTRRQHQGS